MGFVELLAAVYTIYVIPAPPQGCKKDDEVKYCGTQEIRQEITTKFNNAVKIRCSDLKIPFFNLWGNSGVMKKDLASDDLFTDGVMLKEDYASDLLSKYISKHLHAKTKSFIGS